MSELPLPMSFVGFIALRSDSLELIVLSFELVPSVLLEGVLLLTLFEPLIDLSFLESSRYDWLKLLCYNSASCISF